MAVNRHELQLLQRAQELNASRLMAFPNVVGIGTGYRQRRGKYGTGLAVQVFVQRKYPLAELPDWAIVPREVGGVDGQGVPVDVVEVGFVYAAQDTTRYRPVPGGCSIGHQNRVDASTLGGWAGDLTDDTVVLLSCNHCIANLGVASVPGGIVQPGRLDGGAAPGDLIGALKRFIPITTGVVPLPVSPVDAAIGTITVDRTDNVLGTGPAIYELGAPALGMAVQKRGRTTGFTTNGTITSVNVQVTVNYGTLAAPINGLIGNAFIVTSTDGTAFANRGDSGSLIFDQAQGVLNGTRPVVGMFFAVAGGGVTTWHNDINVIFQQLNLTTICNLIIRALLEALGGGRRGAAGAAAGGFDVDRKNAQLRALRDRILSSTPFGKLVADFVASEAAELSQVLLEDDEAFGMAVRTFAPWVRHATNLDVLDAPIDSDTVAHFGRLADRIGERAPRLASNMELMKAALSGLTGARVRDLLATTPPPRPKRPQTGKRRSRR
jgi:hypothetical protein